MATLTLGTAGSYTWYLDYTLTQSVTNNTSTIAYTLRIHKNAGSGAFWGTPARDFRVTIDGTSDTEGFTSVSFAGVTNLNFTSGSKVVTHGANGAHSPVAVSAGVTGLYVSSSFPVPTSFSGKSISLPTIPRAATSITRQSGTQTGNPTTLTLSPLVSSFYYVLEYQSPGTMSWTTIGSSNGIVGTAWPYSTTLGHGEIPNATSGNIQFRVTTLDGSGGSQIGSPAEASFTYTVPSSVVPTAGTPTWAEGASTAGLSTLTNSGSVFAQGWSRLTPTFTATPGTGASPSSATVTVAGVSGSTTSGTAFVNPVTSQGSGSTFDVVVTDSRGRTAHNTGTVSPAVHRWSLPSANAGSAVITPTSSTQTIALSGLQARTTSFYLSSAQRNVLQTRVGYRDITTSGSWVYGSWASQTLSSSDGTDNAYAPGTALTVATGLDPTHEYEVTLQVRDIFGLNSVNYSNGLPYVESSIIVAAQNVLVAFDGNDRVGIKKIPTQGVLDVSGEVYVDDQIYQNGTNKVIDETDSRLTDDRDPNPHTHPLSDIVVNDLGTSDLDAITTQGFYEQPSSGAATSGRHYPAARAGLLEVFHTPQGYIFQRYTTRNGGEDNTNRVFVRQYYSAWSDWYELARLGAEGTPYRTASGRVTLATSGMSNGSSANVTVTFPSGRFTEEPNVTLGVSSSRLGAQADARSATGFRFLAANFSGGTANQGSGDPSGDIYGFWTATQMTPDSANG